MVADFESFERISQHIYLYSKPLFLFYIFLFFISPVCIKKFFQNFHDGSGAGFFGFVSFIKLSPGERILSFLQVMTADFSEGVIGELDWEEIAGADMDRFAVGRQP